MTKKKIHEIESQIKNGEHGSVTKFLYSAELELRSICDFSAYDKINTKFFQLGLELKSMLDSKQSNSPNRQETRLEKLTEKYKTPFEKRVFSVVRPESSSESNRSRKRTADDIEEEEEYVDKKSKTKKTKKVIKKKKKVKAKSKKEDEENDSENPSKKSKIESPVGNKLIPKTPMTNRLSHRMLFGSTVKKTVKVKPMTRRAAAAMAAAKTTQDPPGHVKKLVEKIEQKIMPTPQTSRKLAPVSSIQKTITKLKAIRSSIDKRKSALSMSKLAAKRKSEKQVKAFLTDLKENKIIVEDENKRVSINVVTPDQERLVKESINRVYQVTMPKLPENIAGHSMSAHLIGKVMANSEKRLSKELTTNTSVLSVYRPVNLKSTVSTSAIKQTPSKAIFGSCGNLTNQNLYSNKFTPSKLTRTEVDEKKKAELMAKEQKEKERLQELERQKQEKLQEAKKKRDEKLKKVNEVKQKQEMELKKKQDELNSTKTMANNTSVMVKQNVMASAKKILNPVNLNLKNTNPISNQSNTTSIVINKENCTEFVNSFKKSLLMSQQTAQKLQKQKTVTLLKNPDDKNLEQTYVLNSPVKSKINSSSYECTPLQPPKLRDDDNYDVSDIRSDDDTDDDEEPSKPIPAWAREPLLGQKAQDQCLKGINFTKLFKSACRAEINLEQIFKSKRRKFVERSSSANWTTPPVWSTNGISGEESFMLLRKNC